MSLGVGAGFRSSSVQSSRWNPCSIKSIDVHEFRFGDKF
jgi:hypothetical protein